MKGLSFLSGGEMFAVDVRNVQKVVRNMTYTPVPAAPAAVAGIANMKGGIVTLLSLSELLGRERDAGAVNAVVFNSLTNGNDQMGLLINKPGDLIDINDDEITPPEKSAGNEEIFFISGLAEAEDELYRIISVDLIINQYKKHGVAVLQGEEQ